MKPNHSARQIPLQAIVDAQSVSGVSSSAMGSTIEISYTATVYPNGYMWVRVGAEDHRTLRGEWILQPKFSRKEGGELPIRIRQYAPPENFFLIAASVEPTRENILRFVEKYGLLTASYEHVTEAVPDDPLSGHRAYYDAELSWMIFLEKIKRAIANAQAIDDAWRTSRQKISVPSTLFSGTARTVSVEAAEAKLEDDIRVNLEKALSGDFRRAHELGAEPRRELAIRPKDLASFIWLQIASTLAAGKRIHRCLVCQKWMVSTPGGGRDIKVVCSSTCRTRLWILRKRKAAELHHQGMRPDQIAQELDAEIENVRAWIKEGAAKTSARDARRVGERTGKKGRR
jgi:hypothetical protein